MTAEAVMTENSLSLNTARFIFILRDSYVSRIWAEKIMAPGDCAAPEGREHRADCSFCFLLNEFIILLAWSECVLLFLHFDTIIHLADVICSERDLNRYFLPKKI